jgi:glycolate oxidase
MAPSPPDPVVVDPVVADLLSALPVDRVMTNADVVAAYRHDEAEWADHGLPRAVVRPLETAEWPRPSASVPATACRS